MVMLSPLDGTVNCLRRMNLGQGDCRFFLPCFYIGAWNLLFCPVMRTQTETESLLFLES